MKNAVAACEPEALEPPRRLIIGIGEFAVSNRPGDVIVTHALGSCIAVCLFDPTGPVAGMLHFLLPDAAINPDRAAQQPAAFADTGIPLLFRTAYEYGLDKTRCVVKLVGGAEMAQVTGAPGFNTGRRNALAAKNVLWRNGVFVAAQETGGTNARTLHLSVADGRLRIFNGHAFKEI